MSKQLSVYEVVRIAVVIMLASLAFGSAITEIDNNKEEIKALHVYYRDVSSALTTMTKDIAKIQGNIEIMVKDKHSEHRGG